MSSSGRPSQPRRRALGLLAQLARRTGIVSWSRRHRGRQPVVLVLEYHDVGAPGESAEGTVAIDRFQEHLDCLKRHYAVYSLERAMSILERREEAPSKPIVVITFDDGYRGNAEWAWPALREAGLSGTFFVTTGFVKGHPLWFEQARQCLEVLEDEPRATESLETLRHVLGSWPPTDVETAVADLKRAPAAQREAAVDELVGLVDLDETKLSQPMSFDQIAALSSQGAEVGCHTVTHPILSRQSRERQLFEIQQSRSDLEEHTTGTVEFFAYPNGARGDYDADTVAILSELAFRAACTTLRGANRPGCAPFEIRRIGIGNESAAVLELRLSGLLDAPLRFRDRLRAA